MKGIKIYINQDNNLIPSKTFYNVVGLASDVEEVYSVQIPNETIDAIEKYIVIEYSDKFYALIYNQESGFIPVHIDRLDQIDIWLIDPNSNKTTIREYNLYDVFAYALIDAIPTNITDKLKQCRLIAYYEFEENEDTRDTYVLYDSNKIVSKLINGTTLINDSSQSLSTVQILFNLNSNSIILNSGNIVIKDSNNVVQSSTTSITDNVITVTSSIIITTPGIYTINVPSNTIYLFGDNGQIEILPQKSFQYTVIQPITDITTTGTDRSYYYTLLSIVNNDTSINDADDISFRLSNTDTIIINYNTASLLNPTINLLPKLTRIKGAQSEIIPASEILQTLLTYSYYDEEVLITNNISLTYNQSINLLSTLNITNPKYLKLSVQFTYRKNTIQQGFELYFVNNSLYTRIQNNQYYLPGSIDVNTGEESKLKCGCLLLTNQYDEVVVKGVDSQSNTLYVADIVPNTKVRMGNLTGIHNYTFGTNQPRGYGLYGESVYLTGNFYLNNGRSLVDINKDILLANGNIKEIERFLNSLDSSIRATIEANSIITEANYTGAIATNNNVILKLGRDYSLWALGNAGIVLMNPDAIYNANGEIDPSTVGDGDEEVLLQGNKIWFNTNKSVIVNGITYYEMICAKTSPTSWTYSNKIYTPNDYSNLDFVVRYVQQLFLSNSSYKKYIDRVNGQSSNQYLKYVDFKKTDIGSSVFHPSNSIIDITTDESYLFNNYYEAPRNVFYIYNNGAMTADSDSGDYYAVQRVVTAGMFKDGKFNSDYIETKNLIAFDANGFIKNPDFDVTEPISDSNYPVLNQSTSQIDKSAPFVVVSGTTGKVTAQGMDLKEATIGDDQQSIHLTDNKGHRQVENVNYPAIYFKKEQTIKTKISSIGNYTKDESPIYNYQLDSQHVYNNNIGEGKIEFDATNSSPISVQFQNVILNRNLKDAQGNIITNPSSVSQVNAVRYSLGGNSVYNYVYSPSYNTYFQNEELLDSRKFIKRIAQFTLHNNQSKYITLSDSLVSLTLHNIAYRGNIGINDTFETFSGYITLISGFRITWETTARGATDTVNHYLNHKWISQQNCIIKRDRQVTVNNDSREIGLSDSEKITTLSGEKYQNNSINITNYYNDDITYYLEYVALIQIDNNYNIKDYIPTTHTSPGIVEPGNTTDQQSISIDNYLDTDNLYNPPQSSTPAIIQSTDLSAWNPTNAPDSYSITGTVALSKYVITLRNNNLQTNLQGNGLGVGVNSNNYFGVYLVSDEENNSSINFDLLSEGSGISFSKGISLNTLSNYSMNRYIPILNGTLLSNKLVFAGSTFSGIQSTYNFKGNTLIYKNLTNNNLNKKLLCYYNPDKLLDLFDFYNNTFGTISILYYKQNDLYVSVKNNRIVIIFGKDWNNIFNKFGFSKDQLSINLNGISEVKFLNTPISIERGQKPIFPSFAKVHNFLDQTTNVGILVKSSGVTLDTDPVIFSWDDNDQLDDTQNILSEADEDQEIIDLIYSIRIDLYYLSTTTDDRLGDLNIQINYAPKIQS